MSEKPQWLKDAEARGMIGNVTKVNAEYIASSCQIKQMKKSGTPIDFTPIIEQFPDRIPEWVFQDMVATVASQNGWQVAHFMTAKLGDRHMTPTKYDAAGFPDLVLCRERIIYAELKTETGELTPEEEQWRTKLQAANQEWYLWRPRYWQQIKEILQSPVPDAVVLSL